MINYSAKDKLVIITGVTKGMGLASRKQLLELGAKVVLVYLNDVENVKQVEISLSKYHSRVSTQTSCNSGSKMSFARKFPGVIGGVSSS